MMKTGICIAGPAWIVRSRMRHARRPHRRDHVDEQREHDQPEQVDAVAADLHPGGDGDDEQQDHRPTTARTSAASA